MVSCQLGETHSLVTGSFDAAVDFFPPRVGRLLGSQGSLSSSCHLRGHLGLRGRSLGPSASEEEEEENRRKRRCRRGKEEEDSG